MEGHGPRESKAVIELDDITAAQDPIARNVTINRRYHQMAAELSAFLGAPALCNWATFGQHASRDLGLSLYRGSPDRLRHCYAALLRDPTLALTQAVHEAIDALLSLPSQLKALGGLLRHAYRRAFPLALESCYELPDDERQLRRLLEDAALVPEQVAISSQSAWESSEGSVAVSRTVSRLARIIEYFIASCDRLRAGLVAGNLLIFQNVGRAYSAFLGSARSSAAVERLQFDQDPRGFLAAAFRCYAQAAEHPARRALLVEHGNLLLACQEQLVIAQPIFDGMQDEIAAIAPSLCLHDPEGEHPMLPHGGQWGNLYDRMGFEREGAPELDAIHAGQLPRLRDLQSREATGSIAWYMHRYLHSEKLQEAPAPLPFWLGLSPQITISSHDPAALTEVELDALRQQGDPAADAVVASLLDCPQVKHGEVFRALTDNKTVKLDGLPADLQRFFAETAALPAWADEEMVRLGSQIFGRLGPECVLSLLCGALPVSYAAHHGVQVLNMTGRMLRDSRRRIVETAQFVVDVMAPSGLYEEGHGVRSAQKVRLIHAVVRHMVRQRPDWDRTWGEPINQEDLAGTMLAFSYAVLRCLDKLGCQLSASEREAFLHTWKVAGHLMGLSEWLQPRDYAAADRLAQRIRRRQFKTSEAGRALTQALIDFCTPLMGGPENPWPVVEAMRFLLDDETCSLLGVPARPTPSERPAWVGASQSLGACLPDWARQTGGRKLVESLLFLYRGPERFCFALPPPLRTAWGFDAALSI